VANKKITELTEVTSAGANDVLAVVDVVTPETKKIKVSNLKTSLNIQKSDVGLGNVDNTSDANKPVSTATQTALDLKQDTLVSGTNIKTINGSSILGSGDLVISGGGASYTDASISALDIDWSTGTTFYKAITASSTFTFSNIVAGKTITVAITNATATAYNVTFPTTKQEPGGLETSVLANSATVFTFVSINGTIYCSSFAGVV
jgi:hypothetical protein